MTVKSCWRELDYSFVEKNTNNSKCFLSILFAGFYIVADSVSTYYEGCDGGEMWCDVISLHLLITFGIESGESIIQSRYRCVILSSLQYQDLIRGRGGARPDTSCSTVWQSDTGQVSVRLDHSSWPFCFGCLELCLYGIKVPIRDPFCVPLLVP